MNQMIHFSKCMATRDQQVAEKAAAKQAVAAEDARVAVDMEQRRQAGLKELEVGLMRGGKKTGRWAGMGGGGGKTPVMCLRGNTKVW